MLSHTEQSFYDWVDVYQDFDCLPSDIPPIGERGFQQFDTATGDFLKEGESSRVIEGSYSTTVIVAKVGSSIKVSGNPSRFSRPDNLFGLQSLDDCIRVFNQILQSIHPDIPKLKKCTKVFHRQAEEDKHATSFTDGAYFTRIDVTFNSAVGCGLEPDYIKALSTQRYRNSIPHLHTNGMTVDWRSQEGNARLIYPSVYCKYNDINIHALRKIKRAYGHTSDEYKTICKVRDYCQDHGVVRHEQKLKSQFLTDKFLRFYGLFNEHDIFDFHQQFINLDKRIGGNAMSLESISEQLLSKGICPNTKAANATSMYAIEWMSGKRHDLTKRQVQMHRARLRKIGIEIANPCDLSRFSPVRVVEQKEIVRSPLAIPSWYEMPKTSFLRPVN